MAEQRPLVLIDGEIHQLPAGDTTPGVGGAAADANFSFENVSTILTVPLGQQMSVYQALEISGTLDIEGTVVIYE